VERCEENSMKVKLAALACLAVLFVACAPVAPSPVPPQAAAIGRKTADVRLAQPPPSGEPEDSAFTPPEDWNPHFTQYPRSSGSPASLGQSPPRSRCKPAKVIPVSGSPADVHTPEGPQRGYVVYRQCTRYPYYDVVAVGGNGTKDIPQFGLASPLFGKKPSAEIEADFWAFARAAARAAAVSSIDDVAASATCFGAGNGYGVIVHLHDWRQVDQAIRNLGAWLARGDWNGEFILWPMAHGDDSISCPH
jgi:hypothetical protein